MNNKTGIPQEGKGAWGKGQRNSAYFICETQREKRISRGFTLS